LGLSSNEVNLTPDEAKKAKADYRKIISAPQGVALSSTEGKVPWPRGATTSYNKEEVTRKGGSNQDVSERAATGNMGIAQEISWFYPPVSPKVRAAPSVSGPVDNDNNRHFPRTKQDQTSYLKEVGVQLDPSGLRATAKTRLEKFRKQTLNLLPTSFTNPTNLHLLTYANAHSRLSSQWREYRNSYQDSGMLDPLRGLPDPQELPTTYLLLRILTKPLRVQSDSPGTYILQSETGGSFWDRDTPSKECPDDLARPIPDTVLLELRKHL
jgi:hypothetical protein